jgi:hypothetical protein
MALPAPQWRPTCDVATHCPVAGGRASIVIFMERRLAGSIWIGAEEATWGFDFRRRDLDLRIDELEVPGPSTGGVKGGIVVI